MAAMTASSVRAAVLREDPLFEKPPLAGSAEIWRKRGPGHLDRLRTLIVGLLVLLPADLPKMRKQIHKTGLPLLTPGVQITTSARL